MFGLVTSDAVVLSSSSDFAPGGTMMKSDMQWIHKVGERTLVALHGDPSDCAYVLEVLQATERDHAMNVVEDAQDYPLSTSALAHCCRRAIAEVLRSRPLRVNALLAGWASSGGCTGAGRPVLYTVDQLASLQRVPFAAHGQDLPAILSVLDRGFGVRTHAGPCLDVDVDVDLSGGGGGAGIVPESGRSPRFGRDDGVVLAREVWSALRKRSTAAGPLAAVAIRGVQRDGVFSIDE